jgi:hypothetical protein
VRVAEIGVLGRLTPREQNEDIPGDQSTRNPVMSQRAEPNSQADVHRLEVAADEAVAAVTRGRAEGVDCGERIFGSRSARATGGCLERLRARQI